MIFSQMKSHNHSILVTYLKKETSITGGCIEGRVESKDLTLMPNSQLFLNSSYNKYSSFFCGRILTQPRRMVWGPAGVTDHGYFEDTNDDWWGIDRGSESECRENKLFK